MNPDSNEQAGLGWSFWFVALAPTIAATAGNTLVAAQLSGSESIRPLLIVAFVCGVFINAVCSPLAGIRYTRRNKPTTWRWIHVALYSLLFFAMNVLLLPAGCAVAGALGKAFAK